MKQPFPPGPPSGLLGWRHVASVRQDLVGFAARLLRDYGDVVHFRLGPLSCYQLTHPEHVQEVLVRQAKKFRKPLRLKQVFGRFEGNGLVVSDGELWSRQRRLVQPAFQQDRLPGYAAVVTELTGQTMDAWGPRAEVDVAAEMRRLTLRIVARTLFSAQVEDVVEQIGAAVAALQDWSMREMNRLMVTPSWLPLFGQPKARGPSPSWTGWCETSSANVGPFPCGPTICSAGCSLPWTPRGMARAWVTARCVTRWSPCSWPVTKPSPPA